MWIAWQHMERPWVGTELPCDKDDRALFATAMSVAIGNERTASFWHSSWTWSGTLAQQFSSLLKHSRRKNRMVREALTADTWIADLAHGQTQDLLPAFLAMHRTIANTARELVDDADDTITWRSLGDTLHVQPTPCNSWEGMNQHSTEASGRSGRPGT
ncbi:uncharacterized protein [Aegilops tauschii subsp. strangulata]|uniref:uncharacterized protein n=1 Tax=Aegilops tauschii subsp. strangulata TaxID=200361 RepID=UPI000989BF99|nr:uncharacterized protein LOC109768448 [Aegilops tauschii subsp. strangulata]